MFLYERKPFHNNAVDIVYSNYPSSYKSSPNQQERVQLIVTPLLNSKFCPAKFISMSPCIKKRKMNYSKSEKLNILLKYVTNMVEDESSDMDENVNILLPEMKGIRFIDDVNNKQNRSKRLVKQMSKMLKEEDKINDNLFFIEREYI